MQFISKAVRLAVAVGAVAASATVASAQNVMYTVSGVFTGAGGLCSTNSCTISGGSGKSATLSYLAPSAQSVNAPIFGASLGTLSLSTVGNSTFNFAGVTFALTVTQTVPSNGSVTSSSTVTGSFMQKAGGPSGGPIYLTFDDPTFDIGRASYTINTDAMNRVRVRLPNAGGSANTTDLQADITVANVVPEPSTYALMGAGLLGLVGAVRRRRTA